MAMSGEDAAIQKKIDKSGRPSDLVLCTTALIISNKQMDDIMKTDKSLEGLLIQGISETIKNKAKKKTKRRFSSNVIKNINC